MLLPRKFASLLLLPAALRFAWAQSNSSSAACNNSPKLCNMRYDQVTYLGAHDSPFLRNEETSFATSGNQFYNTTVQLSAGVRLLTAQIQREGSQLHLCHTSCAFLDAGTLTEWLVEVRSWMESNPNEVVTILISNGAKASASDINLAYTAAGITSDLAYTPSGSDSESQTWPTLQSLINSGTRLINFVDYLDDSTAAPYILSEFDYVFENSYDVTSLDGFLCTPNRPTELIGDTSQALSNGLIPLMNHFLYLEAGLGIQLPAVDNITLTNSPDTGSIGSLGSSAAQCTQEYGRKPGYLVVDYFNVGPAIATVDRLNGVSNPVGRSSVPNQVLTSSASFEKPMKWTVYAACLTTLYAFAIL